MTMYKWDVTPGERMTDGDHAKSGRRRIRVAAYCRVSTDEQESSYEAQKKHFMDLLEQHQEWEDAGIYADEGITGTCAKRRKEFLRMLRDCEDGKIDLIVTKSVSRFARNTVDMLLAVRHLREKQVNVVFEKEGLDTRDIANELFLTFWASFAQAESISISKNVQAGIRTRMERGEGRINCNASIGYDNEQGSIDLRIVPPEAVLIRRIFREYLEGCSESMICAHLMAEGIPAPKGGPVWYSSTIGYMLQNQMYMGDLLFQKTYVEDTLTHRVVPNKGQFPQYYLAEHHEPEVPKEIFFMAQGERMRRSALKGTSRRPYRYLEPFHNRIHCGICGRTLKKTIFPDGSLQWRCQPRAVRRKSFKEAKNKQCACEAQDERKLRMAFLLALSLLPGQRRKIAGLQGSRKEREQECSRSRPEAAGAADDPLTRDLYRQRVLLCAEAAEHRRNRLYLRNLLRAADTIEGSQHAKSGAGGCEDTGAERRHLHAGPSDTGQPCRDEESFWQMTDRMETLAAVSGSTWRWLAAQALTGALPDPKTWEIGKQSADSRAPGPEEQARLQEVMSDAMLHRFMENMTINPHSIEVEFRGGLKIAIPCGSSPAVT